MLSLHADADQEAKCYLFYIKAGPNVFFFYVYIYIYILKIMYFIWVFYETIIIQDITILKISSYKWYVSYF